jgi:hypothetical protein
MRKSRERLLAAAALLGVCSAACGQAREAPVELPAGARAVAVAPDYAGTIWLSTGTRLYRSSDGGHTWHGVSGARGTAGVGFLQTALVAVGAGPARLGGFGGGHLTSRSSLPLAAVASPYYRTNRLYGLTPAGRLVGSVRGATGWSRRRARGLPGGCEAIAAVRGDPSRPDVVYVACGALGLWRSGDFGATFRRLRAAGAVTAVATTTDDPLRLLVADARGLELSTDGGRTFRRVARVAGVTAVAIDLRNYRLAYAAAGRVLLRSADGGVTWATSS